MARSRSRRDGKGHAARPRAQCRRADRVYWFGLLEDPCAMTTHRSACITCQSNEIAQNNRGMTQMPPQSKGAQMALIRRVAIGALFAAYTALAFVAPAAAASPNLETE